jgi:hypothetical protein
MANRKTINLLLMNSIKLLAIIGINYSLSYYIKDLSKVVIIKQYVDEEINFIYLMIHK